MFDDKLSEDWHLAQAYHSFRRQEVQGSRQGNSRYQDPRCLQQDKQPEMELSWPVTELSRIGRFD